MTRNKQKYFIVIKSRESSKLFSYQEGQKRLNIYVYYIYYLFNIKLNAYYITFNVYWIDTF